MPAGFSPNPQLPLRLPEVGSPPETLEPMGFYAKYVLPRFIDLAMRNKETARLRAESIPQARGDVLEVGIGSGLNLPFYSSKVRRVYGLEPSFELQRMGRARALAGALEVEFLSQSAEDPVPLADSSIDTLVARGPSVLSRMLLKHFSRSSES